MYNIRKLYKDEHPLTKEHEKRTVPTTNNYDSGHARRDSV